MCGLSDYRRIGMEYGRVHIFLKASGFVIPQNIWSKRNSIGKWHRATVVSLKKKQIYLFRTYFQREKVSINFIRKRKWAMLLTAPRSCCLIIIIFVLEPPFLKVGN